MTTGPFPTFLRFDPLDISGAVFYLDADTLGLSNNDPVSTGIDLSPEGNDVTASLGERPLYKTSGANGKPYLLFDGGDDRLINATTTGLPQGVNGRTVISVVENVTMDDYRPIYSYGSASNNCVWSLAFHTSDDLLSWGYFNDDVIATTVNINTPYCLVHQYDGTNIIVRQNGVEIANFADTISTTGSKLCLGTYINEAYFANIKLYKHIMYDTSLSPANLSAVENYFMAQYGI